MARFIGPCLSLRTLIILSVLKASVQVTHWMVTEDGRIEQQLESVFNMRKPYDLVAFMRQEEEVRRLKSLQKEDSVQQIPESFYQTDNDCIAAKKTLAELDLYISTFNYLDDRGYRLQSFLEINPPPVVKPNKPFCQSELQYSMSAYEHLDGMSHRHELNNVSEPAVIGALHDSTNIDAIGDQLNKTLQKNPTDWINLNLAAFYWRIKGHTLQAIECLRRALHYSPRQHQDIALLSLANVFHNSNHSPDAVVLLHASLEETTEYVMNYFTLGNVYASLKLYDFAIKCYNYVLEDRPGWWLVQQRLHAVQCEKKLYDALIEQHRSLKRTLEELKDFQLNFEKHQESILTRQTLPSEQYKQQMEFLEKTRGNMKTPPLENTQANIKDSQDIHPSQAVKGPDKQTHTVKFKIADSGVVKFGNEEGGEIYQVQDGSIVFTSGSSEQTRGTPVTNNSSEKRLKNEQGKKKEKKKRKGKKKKKSRVTKSRVEVKGGLNKTASSQTSTNKANTTSKADKNVTPSKTEAKGRHFSTTRTVEVHGPETHRFCEINNLISDKHKRCIIARCWDNARPKPSEHLTIDNVMLEEDDEKVRERCQDVNGQQSIEKANKHISVFFSPESKGIDIKQHVNFLEDIGLVAKEPFCLVKTGNNPYTLDHLKGVSERDNFDLPPEEELLEEILSLSGKRIPNVEKVGTYLAHALEKNATSWVLQIFISLYWRVVGRAGEAITCLRAALYFSPKEMKDLSLISLSSIFLRAGYMEDAAITIRMALEISPQLVVSHFTLGNILAHQGNVIEASHHYLVALEYEPTFTLALERLKMVQCVLWRQQKELEKESDKIKKLLSDS